MEFVRDLAIIIIALESFVLIGVVIFLVLKVMNLVDTIHKEIPGLVASAKRTAQTVEGTATFFSKTVATPIIRVASVAAAASKFTQVMLGMDKPKRR
jgi:hypothetical protein